MQNTTTEKTQSTTITKKIGQTTYHIQISFSQTSKDNWGDKVIRLMKNDLAAPA